MKILIKTFACIVVILFTFLSCSDDPEQGGSISSSSSEVNLVSSSSNVQLNSFCENSQNSEEGIPVMDCRVVSYKRTVGEFDGSNRFITDEDTLKLWFPHIFNDEQSDYNCSYFAITFVSTPRLEYFILSKDMILYRVSPYYYQYHNSYMGECAVITMPAYDVMLICDDTAERNLKEEINLDHTSMPRYLYSDWDCREEDEYDRGVFF
ncbi:MAG: hypothetical protein LBU89_12835 [Fibromonadaceae bacterium]|jgi:hypothetical protein|nr:hypothetical protein [Fibromonadaceae bacterium]